MANSYIEYTTGGSGINELQQAVFSYSPIEVISANDVKAFAVKSNGDKHQFTISSRNATAKTVTLSELPSSLSPSVSKVRIYRQTSSGALVDFVDGARLTERDLDTAYKQSLLVGQEVQEDAAGNNTTLNNVTDLTLGGMTTVTNLTATGIVSLPSNTNLSLNNLTTTGTVQIPSGTHANHFYREGTWSAALISGSGINFTVSEAKYRKIGTLVFIHIQCSFSGTSSNRVEISGLPFAVNETAAMNIYHSGGSLPSGASFLAQTHSGHNRFSGGKSNTDMSYTDVNGCNMRISGCYVTS